MKRNFLVVVLSILICMGAIAMVTVFAFNNSNDCKKVELDDAMLSGTNGFIPSEGFVPTKETAIKIAETIWLPIYGETIYEKKPFEVSFDEENQCWYVQGTLPDNTLGGVPEIVMTKSTGEILYVNHSK